MNWDCLAGETIYLDTNVIIFATEGRKPWADGLGLLFAEVDQGAIQVVTSEVTIAEALTQPIALGDTFAIARFQEMFSNDSILKMVPVDRTVLLQAAKIRAELKLKLFDAVHLATARLAGCKYFLTLDDRLGRALTDRPKWLKLSEIT